MNLCASGQLPKEATSPGMPEPMETANHGLANTIRQRHPETFQQRGCQLRAPGRLGNPSGDGERPNGEAAPKEPFLKKERRSGKDDGGWGPQGTAELSSEFPYLGGSGAFIKEINCRHQEDAGVLGKSWLWTYRKQISPRAARLCLPKGGADSEK